MLTQGKAGILEYINAHYLLATTQYITQTVQLWNNEGGPERAVSPGVEAKDTQG